MHNSKGHVLRRKSPGPWAQPCVVVIGPAYATFHSSSAPPRYIVYIHIYISIRCFFLLGTTWTRSFCGELAVTLTLKRRPTPRHFLRSAVHLRRLCHVNANVLPDNVTTPWKYYGKSLSRDSWYEKIRLDNTNSSSILERSRKRSISYFWGWLEILIRIMKIFLWRIVAIFFSLQINKRKIQMGTMNYYGCLEFNFWNDEKYYFETFLWKMIVTFFFFLMINKVDPNGEKMDYCTRLWITRNIFIYDRYFFSQAIKNSGSKWRRWIIVVANLEFNFWERFFFLFFLFLPSRMIIERIQYPSFATFWKQMEGKLASGSCISGNFHPDIFIRAADNVESPRTKRFRGRSWWNGKSFSFSFA